MNLADVLDIITSSSRRCYIHQKCASSLPGADKDFDFEELVNEPFPPPATFLWVGSADTRSSFHFDLTDNMNVQVYGRKRFTLVSPELSAHVYPFRFNVAKSRVDPEDIDLEAFPNFSKAIVMQAVLEPGDVIFIPRLWWHNVRSLEPAISLNHFYGEKSSLMSLARVVNAGGAGHWGILARDFLWYGLLRRKFEARLFSEPPSGKFLYDIVAGGIKRRVFR